MTIFLGFLFLCVLYDVISITSARWYRVLGGSTLALVLLACMMLSYWDYVPGFIK